MREFFYGWRRKVGCGLLVAAIAMAGLWARSQFVCDRFETGSRFDLVFQAFQTTTEGVVWLQSKAEPDPVPIDHHAGWQTSNSPGKFAAELYPETRVWQLEFAGFEVGEHLDQGNEYSLRIEYAIIPYRGTVLPLTLLSAYLLLWKPRKSK